MAVRLLENALVDYMNLTNSFDLVDLSVAFLSDESNERAGKNSVWLFSRSCDAEMWFPKFTHAVC
jgi:hypothetical protein